MLLLIFSATLRLWQLEELPPGLYRDEAYNGLDAWQVLQGEHALFFTANNGREPTFIYLTAVSVALFGRTTFALRFASAVIGTLTTWVTYHLATSWFNRTTGFFTAFLWTITFWPLHLSRLGLRTVLLPFTLALFFWFATIAYRRHQPHLWFITGLIYASSFYTYLASRFTPVLLFALLLYMLFAQPTARQRLQRGLAPFGLGFLLALSPFLLLWFQQPELILGRTQQVSILSPSINNGDLWGTLLRQIGRALGMFFWQGDTIWRHNLAGRPVFDLSLLLPFFIGLFYALYHWRRLTTATLLIWSFTMLGPTILAEDTPHFLRSVGILPAVLIFPALGLAHIWHWPKLPIYARRLLVIILAGLTTFSSLNDYFFTYAHAPTAHYFFESAAQQLASDINNDLTSLPNTPVLVHDILWSSWPSLHYLITPTDHLNIINPDQLTPPNSPNLVIYSWPYGSLSTTHSALQASPLPTLLHAYPGPLARGDLEPEAYSLYSRYYRSTSPIPPPVAIFDNQIYLHEVNISQHGPAAIIDLIWTTTTPLTTSLTTFVHLVDATGLITQTDQLPAQNLWPTPLWQPNQAVHDRHLITIPPSISLEQTQLFIGLYPQYRSDQRLLVTTMDGTPVGNAWTLPFHE
ncbi:MAG TPA: glycosyltransferase family 39 protein [Anaerolineae bacterium]|nr:glycosyltransferase family 39 protein [Anaerolineae bacterium]